jgi:hypothetical protein
MNKSLTHSFDIEISQDDSLDLFAEELPEQVQLLSDCLSSASSFSCAGGCFASLACIGSIGSCGDDNKNWGS